MFGHLCMSIQLQVTPEVSPFLLLLLPPSDEPITIMVTTTAGWEAKYGSGTEKKLVSFTSDGIQVYENNQNTIPLIYMYVCACVGIVDILIDTTLCIVQYES